MFPTPPLLRHGRAVPERWDCPCDTKLSIWGSWGWWDGTGNWKRHFQHKAPLPASPTANVDKHARIFLKLFQKARRYWALSLPAGPWCGSSPSPLGGAGHGSPRGKKLHSKNSRGEQAVGLQLCQYACGFVWAPLNEAQQLASALPLSLQRTLCQAAHLSSSSDFPRAEARALLQRDAGRGRTACPVLGSSGGQRT